MKPLILSAVLGLFALPAPAVEVSTQLVLTLEGNAQRDVVSYTCEGWDETLTVDYINAHPVFLAIVPIEGENPVFANIVSASGARYASGRHIWWTQGNDAFLYDETAGEDAEPVACHVLEDIP